MGFLLLFSAVAGVEGTVILHSEKKASSHYHNYSSIYTIQVSQFTDTYVTHTNMASPRLVQFHLVRK